jgi:myosin heavy subunit
VPDDDDKENYAWLCPQEVYLNRKSDDEALKRRLLQLSSEGHNSNSLRPVRLPSQDYHAFAVQHYAGEVQYSVTNMVTKNKVRSILVKCHPLYFLV